MLTIRDDDYVWLNLLSDFIEDFVAPSDRARMYYLLSKPNRRSEVIHDLCYEFHLDPRYLRPIPKGEQSASEIYARLRKLGAPTCCFAFNLRDDSGNEWIKMATDLETVLERCVGWWGGVILYCPQEKLGYWEEHHGDRWILNRALQTPLPKRR